MDANGGGGGEGDDACNGGVTLQGDTRIAHPSDRRKYRSDADCSWTVLGPSNAQVNMLLMLSHTGKMFSLKSLCMSVSRYCCDCLLQYLSAVYNYANQVWI